MSTPHISGSDPTCCVLGRGSPIVPLEEVAEAQAFVVDHLFQRATISEDLLPGRRVALLYGREGTGKTTLVNRCVSTEQHWRDLGYVADFRLRAWNLQDFKTWMTFRLRDIHDMRTAQHDARAGIVTKSCPERMTLIIGGIHHFNYGHGNDEVITTFVHLLTAVRMHTPSSQIRVLLLCDENPGQFPGQLLNLIDRMHLMGLPGPDARGQIMRNLWAHFKMLKQREASLEKLGWDIPLGETGVDDDPAHVIHTLVVASSGCTPREIVGFMRRTFSGCARPNEAGTTVYDAAWIESLLYKLEGGITCIIPSNPAALNEPFFKYAGMGVTAPIQPLGTNNKSCFVRDAPLVLNPNAGDNAEDEAAPPPMEDADGLNAEGKRPRIELQPPSVKEALQARLTQQGEAMASAARNAKRIAGRNRHNTME
jgi:hypothetical protein